MPSRHPVQYCLLALAFVAGSAAPAGTAPAPTVGIVRIPESAQFRAYPDITFGSDGICAAKKGCDFVTGAGSPTGLIG
ncbi:MAG: hypothetical protein WDO13_13545 [Verrucomicrobiota bacterium]